MKIKNLILGLSLMALFTAACSKSDDSTTPTIAVSSSNVLSDSVTVQWPAIENTLFYDVDVYKGEEYLEGLSHSVENKTEFIVKGLLANTEYEFVVTAYSTSGDVLAEGSFKVTTEPVLAGLVGTWKYEYSTLIVNYIFNADGTGSYKYGTSTAVSFTWKVKTGKILVAKMVQGFPVKEWLTYSIASDNNSLATIGGTIYFKQ